MIVERFWSKVDTSGECWEWLAFRDRDGYGLFGGARGTNRAHRIAYELTVGSIPDGLQLDHLCRNRGCVNPSHLEPVTPKVNSERGIKATATHCLNGHEFNGANTYVKANGTRSCRVCHREGEKRPESLRRRAEAQRRYLQRKKAS